MRRPLSPTTTVEPSWPATPMSAVARAGASLTPSPTSAFRLLSDPTRIKILWALLQDETSVARLAEIVVAAPTAVSQHLSKLRFAGLVHGRRQGTFIYYRADDDRVRRLLHEALFHVTTDGAREADQDAAPA
jgi:DNA-binding transcriptional ArsR family regulator